MKNRDFKRKIFGDLPTQKMAQKALPILISSAQEGDPVIMRDLVKEIAPDLIQFNFTMRHVLAWIHTTLWELERSEDWNYGEIPGITAIFLDSPKTPTKWMEKETRVDPNTPLLWKDYKTEHIQPVFKYPHWDKVADFVFGFNVNLDEVDLNNFIIDEVQPSLLGSEPEEEEQEIPEGEHRYFVYAWRWCGDERFAKIGRTRNGLKGVENRMVTTYHPTDDPVPLGVRECADAEESHKTEQYILNGLERTRPDREWVEIDEKFNDMIDKSFISDSDELKRIFGENIKTEKIV